ncbi:MAG TPA: chemotaxis protein CheW [Polyangiaceae bacterium]|jgi:purine-binding chemotaxis protein CheW
MSDQHPNSAGKERANTASKYMTFKLAKEEYGIEILKVRELIGLLEITRVPRTKPYIRGLINLRGKVIPVVDLRAKFGMPPTDATSQTVIIVVQIAAGGASLTMGVLVDEVLEVRAIAEADIEAPPALPQDIDTSFILGVGKVDKHIVFLLDIDRVLTVDERSEVLASATVSGAQVQG